MHDHELELIAALVEGRLDDESEARALIATSPEAQAEYEAQKLVFEALRSEGTARMSDGERAALHRDLWTELRVGSESPSRAPWYYRWAPVAAGLFVVVGLVSVLTQAGQPVSEEFSEIGSDLSSASATTAAASEEATAADGGGDGAAEQGDDALGETDVAEAAPFARESAVFYSIEAEKVRQGDFEGALQSYDNSSADGDTGICLETSDLDDYEVVATLDDLQDEDAEDVANASLIVAVPRQADRATAPVAFVDPNTCELVHLDE